ncbi:MAG TPA: cytochrome c oxidase subunit II [Nitriliruptorales bacterium]|nr:cytochrome c oxidase subunit II [Nitriliruptorales bacterium]
MRARARAGWRWRALTALLPVTTLVVTACATNTAQTTVEQGALPQDALSPVGRFAIQTDELWNLVLWVAIVIFVFVEALIVVAILRFRERPDDGDRLPKQIHGNPRLEAIWTVIPALILAGVAVPTVRVLFDLADEPEGNNVLSVDVIGHQWWWEYQYPQFEGLETANILHIPTDQTVVLKATSDDVIHSFWVPKLAGKQDTVPGRESLIKLYADEPGEYLGQCAEFCGLSHANMRLRVIAHEPADFQRWAQQQARSIRLDRLSGQAARGRDAFVEGACVGCHSIRGLEGASGTVGPDLTYFSDRGWFAGAIFENTDESLRDWLADPPKMKPMEPGDGRGMPDLNLSDQEIDALVAFLRELKTPDQ